MKERAAASLETVQEAESVLGVTVIMMFNIKREASSKLGGSLAAWESKGWVSASLPLDILFPPKL